MAPPGPCSVDRARCDQGQDHVRSPAATLSPAWSSRLGDAVSLARDEIAGPSPRARRAARLVAAWCAVRRFGRRHRVLITVVGSLAAGSLLAFVLAGRRHEFAAAISQAAAWVLAVTALLQIVALVARSEAWHLTIEAAGGTVARRVLYRASSVQVLGSVLNAQLGVAARIAALRRSSPAVRPPGPTLIAAAFPILALAATP